MKKKIIFAFSIAFGFVELIMLVLILTLKGQAGTILSFCSIAISFLYSMLFLSKNISNTSTSLALLFATVSDIFLVLVSPRIQTVAMTTFSVTQIMLAIRLFCNANKKQKIWQCILRAVFVIIVLIVTVIVLKGKVDYLSVISMFYYSNLIFNVIVAFTQIKKSKLLAIGLLLFLCCDTLVGISTCAPYISIPKTNILYVMATSSFNWIWLFYLPSQVLIAYSLLEINKKTFS